ncbi:MAG TPA: fluoride efflux transporter CrcB [Thermoanaerobaculia bacterium]|nr:fluoride efflux transporter CrcB [Thermoanaerobaculia bacterium]
MMRLLLVCLGGAIGSGARYLTALWAASAFGPAFPSGTLIVNLLGSFLIAFIMHVSSATELIPPDVRVLLTTGVMGGFTTYSTFNYETTGYFRDGAWGLGMMNVGVTVIGCLVAGLLGLMAARLMFGR